MASADRRHGDAMAHSCGLDVAPLLTTRSLRGPQVVAAHIVCGPRQIGPMVPIPPEETFVAAVNLIEMPRYEICSRGRPSITGRFAADTLRILDLADELSGYIFDARENIVFHIPRASLDAHANEEGTRRVARLACPHGSVDPTMVNLARALLPAFGRPHEANAFFVDQMLLAVCVHLVERYGDNVSGAAAPAQGGLTPAQLRRAKEMLAGHLKGDLLVTDLARACGVSRQRFVAAFCETVGCTPHQWMQRMRVDKAMDMLKNTEIPIGELAPLCGFADQRHLTRVFAASTGVSPAVWRRRHRS